ncbi:histone H3.v1-like [Sebastes umbrosus]|uniref:histone H3.v1-like n=1 Tax=Sebastes umbrosus TaxID=72105 RepID=UPI00189DBAB5|nr:histone H3.v1-like [Sebastes umbrosus]
MEEDLPMGVAPELDNNRPGGVNYIIERPARDGLPEDDDDEGNLPVHISSNEEEDGEVEIAVGEGEVERNVLDEVVVRLLSDIEEEEEEEEEDSGYESMCEDEEDNEEDNINVIIRPRSPLNQRFPPPSFWQGFRRGLSPPVRFHVSSPFSLVPFGIRPAPLAERPEEGRPSVCQRSEVRSESVPSTSGLSCSTKRSREEDCTEQVSVKRRHDCEDSHEVPALSSSGLGSSTKRSRQEDYYRYGFRRYWESAPDDSDSDSD